MDGFRNILLLGIMFELGLVVIQLAEIAQAIQGWS